jgi:hypothetical protein
VRPLRAERRRIGAAMARQAEAEADIAELKREEALENAVDRQLEREDAAEAAGVQPRMPWPRRIAAWAWDKRLFLGAAIISAACASGAVIGQVNYYLTVFTGALTVLAYLFPVAVETISWWYGAAAARAVHDRQPSAKLSQRMWLFASFAAAVNAWHGVEHLHSDSVGILLGLLSMFGPLVWHSYTGITRLAMSGRSFDEIKVAAKTRLLSPIVSWKADRIEVLLDRPNRKLAWKLALAYSVKDVRAMLSINVKNRFEAYRWGFVMSEPTGSASDTMTTPTRPETSLPRPGVNAHGGVLTVNRDLSREPDDMTDFLDPDHDLGELIRDLDGVTDVNDLLASWVDATGGHRDHASIVEQVHQRTIESDHDQPTQVEHGQDLDSAPTSDNDHERRGSRERKPKRRRAPAQDDSGTFSRTQLVIQHWWSLKDQGIDPAGVTQVDVAREFNVDPAVVSRVWKQGRHGVLDRPESVTTVNEHDGHGGGQPPAPQG